MKAPTELSSDAVNKEYCYCLLCKGLKGVMLSEFFLSPSCMIVAGNYSLMVSLQTGQPVICQ